MHTGQTRTELAERVGFECLATALILHDRRICRRAPYRHYFRQGDVATIKRMTHDVVLRGLRTPPPYTHVIEFHLNSRTMRGKTPQTQQNTDSTSRLNTLRCGEQRPETPPDLCKTLRSAHREFAQGLRLWQPSFRMLNSSPGLRVLGHHLSAGRWVSARRRGPRRWTIPDSRLFRAASHRGSVVGDEDAFKADFQFLIVEPDYGAVDALILFMVWKIVA